MKLYASESTLNPIVNLGNEKYRYGRLNYCTDKRSVGGRQVTGAKKRESERHFNIDDSVKQRSQRLTNTCPDVVCNGDHLPNTGINQEEDQPHMKYELSKYLFRRRYYELRSVSYNR